MSEEEGPLDRWIPEPSSRDASPFPSTRIASPSYSSISAAPASPQIMSDRSASPELYSRASSPGIAPTDLPGLGIRAAPASPQIVRPQSASPALILYESAPGSESATCVFCLSEVDDSDMVVRVNCGHTFHMACIQDMFLKATVDESAFPPKCCKVPIQLAEVERYLAPVLVDRFRSKTIEFSTANRVYCHNRRCSVFLSAATTSPTVLLCPRTVCMSSTCGSCKQRAHPGAGCRPAGGADDAVLKIGKAAGWQRCYSCQHLIERDVIGCYHMTCRCGKEFCYLCGVPWKGCKCELFFVPPEEEESQVARVPVLAAQARVRPSAAPATLVPQAGYRYAGLSVRA
ncbi:hypothetical protein TRAPUB_10828 [Trametes pubescens]|uniref:RBR-type E3 ubiquitin transferase n=1 Tax=Trametes pubescens TaxID=154538 RepID=A0A1M2VYB2_TRAPU|nr:hypothetical protein TRAPUB_10828 [Trametes pubescens]